MVHRGGVALSALLFVALGMVQVRAQEPQLKHRPTTSAEKPAVRDWHLHLDVMANDGAGNPVTGLQPWDFHLTDNGKPSKILFFRAFDGAGAKPEPPVEVILLIDEINLPFSQVAFVKGEVARFLEQNGGRLAHPVSMMLLTNKGLRVQPRPSQNGEELLKIVHGIQGSVRVITPQMGGNGSIERVRRSVRAIDSIAVNEAQKPGRKLLIWVGPGWPLLAGRRYDLPDDRAEKRYFRFIVDLTNELREARITVYSVSGVDPAVSRDVLYQEFLKGVPDFRAARAGDLALKVLAVRTGGLVLGPDNDLVGQIHRCIEDADAFYQLSFAPAVAQHPDEYHALKVTVDRPGVAVRMPLAYYAEPSIK